LGRICPLAVERPRTAINKASHVFIISIELL
jgi:hypothetical protein